jgi:hypothetical protein
LGIQCTPWHTRNTETGNDEKTKNNETGGMWRNLLSTVRGSDWGSSARHGTPEILKQEVMKKLRTMKQDVT